jgi:hypothetical protein
MDTSKPQSSAETQAKTCNDPQTGQLVYTDDETARMRGELRAGMAQIVEIFRKQGYTVNPISM